MGAYSILVVDDARDVRRVLVAGLQTLGHKIDVMEVPSAEEAMILAPRKAFDLVVTDVRLPGISGLDFVARLRAKNPNLKIILMTGAEDRQTRKQVEAAGTFAFFYKPIELADFLDAVERALGLVETAFPPAPLTDSPKQTADQVSKARPIDIQPRPSAFQPRAATRVDPYGVPPALERLLQGLGAQAAMVLDEVGKPVFQAGELSSREDTPSLWAALLSAFAANQKLSAALDRPEADYLLCLDGRRLHLCLAAVNAGNMLLIFGRQSFKQAATIGQVAAALPDLRAAMPAPAVPAAEKTAVPKAAPVEPPPPPAPEPEPAPPVDSDADLLAALAAVEVSEADRAAIDDLFGGETKKKPAPSNLDDFWDSVAEEHGSVKMDESHISFDQARNLGLAPE